MERKDKREGLKNIQTDQKKISIVHRFQNPRPLKGSTFSVNLKCCYLSFIEKIQAIRRLYSPLGVGGSGAKVNCAIIDFKPHQWGVNVLFSFLLLLSACATREEGCNDALANNFDLGADKPCDGCCEYPGIRIRLTHKYGGTAMAYNQAIFTDGAGNTFGFGDLRFYLSTIQVLSVGNKVIDVQEPLDVYLEKAAGDTVKTSIPNSYGLARGLGQADMYIQSYRDTATINRIRFTIGVSGEMNQANPLRLPNDHPMRSSVNDGMYLGAQNGYVFARSLYYAQDTVDIKISGSTNLRTVELSFTPTKLQRGYNLNILMDVDYALWFQTVNVNSDTPAQISQKIIEKLTQSFTITQVSTSL